VKSLIGSWTRAGFAVLLLAALAGCEGMGRAQPVDLSSPQSAAMAYLKALQRGDAPTARAACVGNAAQMRWVDALAAMIDGIRKLDAAVHAKFGFAASQLNADLEQSLNVMADEPVDLYANGSVQTGEAEAVVKPERKGFTSQYQLPLALRKVEGRWKLNLAATYMPQPTHEQLLAMSPQQRQQFDTLAAQGMSEAFRKYHRAADVFHKVAGKVRAGSLRNPHDVENALAEAGR
jgi:hypothetical protein